MPNVLVIEDRFEQQRLYQLLGTKLNFTTVVTDCCDAALKAVRDREANAFQLVIVDWVLPGADGATCIEELKKLFTSKASVMPPFICITAKAMTGDREECLEAGFDDYLAKPFSIAEIQTVLNKWIHTPQPDASAV